MVEHIGDYEDYATIYQLKRGFNETNDLMIIINRLFLPL